MKASTVIRFTATAGALLFATALQAQPPMAPPIQMFDKDGNGTVSEQEFNQGRAERMAKMAESGRLMRNAGKAPQFSDIDANADGEATLEEFVAARRAMMEKRRAERMAQAPGMRRPMHAMPRKGMGPGHHRPGGCMHKGRKHGKMGGHHGMQPKGKPRYSFDDIDLDGDGMISREEFDKHHANR